MTNRTARNRPRADRAKRKRVARNRSERTRVVRIRAKRTRVARDRAEHTRVVRDRAERTRVVCIRAERTRSRSASVRAFVERLNAQPYELFKPRHRPPLSSRQFSLSTRVYRCLTSSILSTPILPWSYWQYFSTRVQSLPRQRFSPSTRHALPSQLLSGCLCLITSCQPSVGIQPLSARCCPSPVVGQWGGKGSLPSVSHSRRTNGREAEMSLSSWRWIWSNQDLSNQDGNEDANNN